MTFTALVADKTESDGYQVGYRELTDSDLMPGDVTVSVEWSTVNYKDGMAMSRDARIVSTFPCVLGIDFAGTVTHSGHADYQPGDAVIANGFGLSQTHHGGYAEVARVPGDWLIRRPASISARQSMAIGTAGYTAMLCVLKLEQAGIGPDSGNILVTGASGGVGTIAIAVLEKLGYHVIASTGKVQETDFLQSLGAAEVIHRDELGEPGRPVARSRWAGAIDSVGSHTLANALAATSYGGAVAACGLAQGPDLPATVLPFITRGVSLLGVDSVRAPLEERHIAWDRLVSDLDLEKLDQLTREIGFRELKVAAESILAGQIRGRTVVAISA